MKVFVRLLLVAYLYFPLAIRGQCRLYGIVSNTADSTKKLSSVTVQIPSLAYSAQSDETGHYTLNNIPKGTYTLYIQSPGFTDISTIVQIKDSLVRKDLKLNASEKVLGEVVIYGEPAKAKYETANTIDVLDASSMREQGALSLSDGIAKLPGVNQLTTGAGISKPVIRGLFGNRIQTVLLGLRFDNQQWQDEHGLGLSDIGVDRVEIIKGPSSLFYGSEAMGGVLNIVNEKNAPVGKLKADLSTRFFSNTYGYAVDAGVKRSGTYTFWGIRLGKESHADYSDGNGKRILNSRFGSDYAKATFGFKYKKWRSENTYMLSQSNFGFLMDAYQLYDKPDDRLSRSFERPHHTVLINIFSSQNMLYLKASKLKITAGAHVNNRQEQEGSGGISLNMLLNTYVFSALWTKSFTGFDLSVGSQDQYQTNRNIGSRTIVPDANLQESSLFCYLKKQKKFFVAEGGLRYDLKSIETLPTGALNNGNTFNPGLNIIPVNRQYNVLNGSAGISLFDAKHINVKMNASSGYRGPNLAELSSNGLHEGSLRYEVGNVNLKTEQNVCMDAYAEYYNKQFSIYVDAYVNRFLNYIYLQPSDKDYLGFRIYNYIQKNATIKGLEGGIKIHPSSLKFLQLSSTYSGIIGQTDNHEYLPFIPAQKINNEVKFTFSKIKGLSHSFATLGCTSVFAQNTPNQFETPTAAYNLVNAGIGTEIPGEKFKLLLSLSGNNLLNEVYYDHLSRFKYFGIYNIGRSFCLNIKLQFN